MRGREEKERREGGCSVAVVAAITVFVCFIAVILLLRCSKMSNCISYTNFLY